jgi:hypothetical protein
LICEINPRSRERIFIDPKKIAKTRLKIDRMNPSGFFQSFNNPIPPIAPMMGRAPNQMNSFSKPAVVGQQVTLYIGNLDKKVSLVEFCTNLVQITDQQLRGLFNGYNLLASDIRKDF